MNITSRLNYKTARLKRKLYDNHIKLKGKEIHAIRLAIDEDRYSNRDYGIASHNKIDMVIDLPSKEIFLGNSTRINNPAYEQFASIYSLLPITGYPKNSDDVLEQGDILLFKYLLTPYDDPVPEYFLQALMVAAPYGRMDSTLLYRYFHLAPHTINLEQYPEIETILNEEKIEPVVLF